MAYRRYKGRRSRRGLKAKIASRRAFRKAIRTSKRKLAKKYANTVGQIAFRGNRTRPRHGGRRFRGRRHRRY